VWAEGSQRAEIPFPRISATRRRATLPHEHARRHSTLFHRCPLGHLPWPVSRCMCEVLRPGMCFERIQSDCDPLSVSSHRFSLESCRLIVLACRCSGLSCESRELPNQALICCGGLCVWVEAGSRPEATGHQQFGCFGAGGADLMFPVSRAVLWPWEKKRPQSGEEEAVRDGDWPPGIACTPTPDPCGWWTAHLQGPI
jgi:hypothetical protein